MSTITTETAGAEPLLKVRGLNIDYRTKNRFLSFGNTSKFRAVTGVSFDIACGETLGVVGESGSGKSTTARAIVRLIPAAGGTVKLDGKNILDLSGKERMRYRRRYQMVFQDPYSSLNPSMTIMDIVSEPLKVHGIAGAPGVETRVIDSLERVGLSAEYLYRYPYEFSGGQRQRIAIARAIVLRPDLIIFDEPVSALDVPTQNQIINLLEEIRRELGTAFMIIAHDLGLLHHIAHRVAVMYLGRLVEIGPTDRLYRSPSHPYTKALLDSEPLPDPVRQRARRQRIIKGELPDPANPPKGCVFNTRCSYAMPICMEKTPPLTSRGHGQLAACHLSVPPEEVEIQARVEQTAVGA
jgi:oligopeptide/dipeptide ABC transporter ATP-binding protein